MSERIWYKISEKQLNGLVNYEHKHMRECLANAVKKQMCKTICKCGCFIEKNKMGKWKHQSHTNEKILTTLCYICGCTNPAPKAMKYSKKDIKEILKKEKSGGFEK